MPFVTDIYPPSKKIESVAGLGLVMGARKGKGFPGKRQYEEVEILGCFSVPLQTVTYAAGEEGCRGLVLDPQGLLTGEIKFDLAPSEPQGELRENMLEEEFILLCQQETRAAADFTPEFVEYPGLITDPVDCLPLLKSDGQNVLSAGLDNIVDGENLRQSLQGRFNDYNRTAAAWADFRQQVLAYRDRVAEKINESAEEARKASNQALTELEQQVKSAIADKNKETEQARDKAREEHQRQKELLQSELSRFQEQFKEQGEEYWREKIKAEENRLAENDKQLTSSLEYLIEVERKYAHTQKDRLKQFQEETDKRLTSFQQRLKRLDAAVAGFVKGVEKRLERCEDQLNKIKSLTVSLAPEQCSVSFPVVFYAARYTGERWQVFPPQIFGNRGIKGKLASLVGSLNLPFLPASKAGEQLAEKLQEMLPGSELENRLLEQNLLKDSTFLSDAREGLAQLIDQGDVPNKYADLFESK